ncbi:MAG: hypothetical protein AVDCRST_MAG88-148, partial [uncultured Thermomicrobiales bacterium]
EREDPGERPVPPRPAARRRDVPQRGPGEPDQARRPGRLRRLERAPRGEDACGACQLVAARRRPQPAHRLPAPARRAGDGGLPRAGQPRHARLLAPAGRLPAAVGDVPLPGQRRAAGLHPDVPRRPAPLGLESRPPTGRHRAPAPAPHRAGHGWLNVAL